jgi:hypothetical protein
MTAMNLFNLLTLVDAASRDIIAIHQFTYHRFTVCDEFPEEKWQAIHSHALDKYHDRKKSDLTYKIITYSRKTSQNKHN